MADSLSATAFCGAAGDASWGSRGCSSLSETLWRILQQINPRLVCAPCKTNHRLDRQHMIQITIQSIDLGALLPLASHPDCGAQVMFVGTTRRWTGEIETAYLEYEAYEQLALQKLRELESAARQRWPLREVILVHRVGRVEVAEPSVAVLVASPHRAEAFEAAKWLIDELKHQVPIWKQEHYVQNGAEWIHPTSGNCQCAPQAAAGSSAESAAQPSLHAQQQAAQQ
jgi:molybdopterin synthase catalytic subunit